jgi:hypothetical protein
VAIGIIMRLPEGAGALQYDAVRAKLDIANDPPDDLILHSAGELEGPPFQIFKTFQIFNLWESREQADRFNRERLQPARVEVMGEERAAAIEAGLVEVQIYNYVIP